MKTLARVLLLVLLFAASAPAADPPRMVVLNFDNADVEVVVQAAAEIAGFNYVFGPNVRGRKVTLQTVGKIPREEVLNFLLTVLDANGLAAIKSDNVYRIITREGAPQTPLRTVVGREPAPDPAGGEVITQIVPLKYLGAADAAALLRPYVAAEGAVSAHRETNLLILTDTASNIRRVLEILKVMDVPVALEEPQIIPLQHADAQELAQLLTQFFLSRMRGGAAIASPPVPGVPPAPGAPPRPSVAVGELGGVAERPPLIVAERRSNALVVHARKQELEAIRRLVEQLDVNIRGGQQVFVHFAENTKARDLATTLDAIYGRGDRGPAITGSQSPRGGGLARARRQRRAHPDPGPAPAAALAGRGADKPVRRGAEARDPLHRRRGHQRGHRDDLSAAVEGDRGDHQAAGQDAPPGARPGARRRGHAHRRHPARHGLGGAEREVHRHLLALGALAVPPGAEPDPHAAGRSPPGSASSPSPPTGSSPRSMPSPPRTGSTCSRTPPS